MISGFSSDRNKAVARRLVTESKAHLPDTSSSLIIQAAKTYFGTGCGIKKLKSSGKYNSKVILQRRKNRIVWKMKNRKAALMRTSALTEKEKKIWEAVMSTEMMSSEERDAGSNSDNESSSALCKRPLPWRNEKVSSFFKSLDHKVTKGQSKQSQQITQNHTAGVVSQHPKPAGFPDWVFK